MNIIPCIVGLLFIALAFWGYKKGLLGIALSLASMIVSIVACLVLTPVVAGYIRNNTDFEGPIQKGIYSILIENDDINNALNEKGSEMLGIQQDLTDKSTNELCSSEALLSYIEEIGVEAGIPKVMFAKIKETKLGDKVQKVVGDKADNAKAIVVAAIATRLAEVILNAIVYVIIFALIFVLMRILVSVTNIFGKLPLIKEVNQFAGLVAGLLEALLITWLMFALITACGSMEWAATMITDIGENPFLSFLYNNNIIFNSVLKSI